MSSLPLGPYEERMLRPSYLRKTQYVWEKYNSPRSPSGALLIRRNPLRYYRNVCVMMNPIYRSDGVVIIPDEAIGGTAYASNDPIWTRLNNEAVRKLRGKERQGSADLYLNCLDFLENRDMVINRLNWVRRKLDTKIEHLLYRTSSSEARLIREREPLANQFLEQQFGWQPTISDIHAGVTSVIQGAGIQDKLASAATYKVDKHRDPMENNVSSNPESSVDYTDSYRVRFMYDFRVRNPNLWLLNRAGFTNPLVAFWDKIPWSFVANWFININDLLLNMSDDIGIERSSIWYVREFRRWRTSTYTAVDGRLGYACVLSKYYERTRIDSLPGITAELRVPHLDLGLMAIASALVVQRVKKINNWLRIV